MHVVSLADIPFRERISKVVVAEQLARPVCTFIIFIQQNLAICNEVSI